jgi:hypothetical protein
MGEAAEIVYPYCKAQIDRDGYPGHPFFPTNFGGECNFNIDNDREYLPDADFYTALSANVPEELRKDALAMQMEIDQLQNPKDCNRPKSVHVNQWHLILLPEVRLQWPHLFKICNRTSFTAWIGVQLLHISLACWYTLV